MSSDRVLDLFAGPGGTARGFQQLGYEVIGVDLDPHPKYPGECIEHDLRDGLPEEVRGESYAYGWGSPPCLPFTTVGGDGPNLIPLARELLEEIDAEATILENVPGAGSELEHPITLSGATEHELIDLDIRKRRVFEVSWFGTSPPRDRDARFGYAIGSRETPAQGYREAHGLGDSGLHTKELHDAIPPDYVALLVWQHRRTKDLELPVPLENQLEEAPV